MRGHLRKFVEGLKRLFRKEKPISKQIGGLRLPGGFAIGPMLFSKDGRQGNAIMMPAIVAFDYGVTNAQNRLRQTNLPPDELQEAFNSLTNALVAEMLLYFANRLKPIAMKSNVGQMNDMGDCVAAYHTFSIDVESLCDTHFLTALDRVRGRRQHTDRRYDDDYTIAGTNYDTVGRLRELAERVRQEIHTFDKNLAATHKDYDVKVTQSPTGVSVEFKALNHAFDLTKGGKVVPPKREGTEPPKAA